jgi:hypothetical protein
VSCQFYCLILTVGVIGKRQTVIVSDEESDQETTPKPSGKPRMCSYMPLPEILDNRDILGKRTSRVLKEGLFHDIFLCFFFCI